MMTFCTIRPAAIGLLLAATAALAGAASPAAAATMTVWTQGIAAKVQPTTAPGPGATATMEGAATATEAYQIVVRATAGSLAGVNMRAGNLSDGAGHTIPKAEISFFREAFIDFTGVNADTGSKPVPAQSPTHDGRIPDPLIPFLDPYAGTPTPVGAPFAVKAGENQPVWMDVHIPKGTVAGTYTGSVTVTASGVPPVVVPVSVTVWDLTLPDMRTITTHFRMSEDTLINYHAGIYDCSSADPTSCWLNTSAAARRVVKRYEQLAHEHRIDTAESFLPDPGNGCKPPTAAAWDAYDAAIKPYMTGTYWTDRVPSGRVETPFSPGVTWGLEASCNQTQYTALAKAWAQHLAAKGWFDNAVVYAADEPDPTQYAAIARNALWMRTGAPGWKPRIMDTTEPRPSNVAKLSPALGIFAVCLACYDGWWDQSADHAYGRKEWPSLFQKGIQLWFYESNAQAAPYPTYATNTLYGMEPQMMKWGAWYEQATGFLMWDMTDWDRNNPWGPNISYGKTGDGVLIYPGNHDGLAKPHGSPAGVAIAGPLPSYRLKMIRAGLQDWALFNLAASKGLTTYARQQVARAYGQLGGCYWSGCTKVNGSFFWRSDGALLASIRHNIAAKIESTP